MNYQNLSKKLIDEFKKARQQGDVLKYVNENVVGKKFEVNISEKVTSINEEKKTAVFVISTSSIDRHGEVIDQDSWILDYFKQNPVLFWQHESWGFPLGSWEKVWLEADPNNIGKKRLMGRARFDTDIEPNAKRAWDHINRGNLRMVSAGFIPNRIDYDEETDTLVLYDCELLEVSLVGIGSNRDAVIKEAGEIKPEIEKPVEAEKPEEAEEPEEEITKGAIQLKEKLEQTDFNKDINKLKARELLNKAINRLKKS